MSDNNEMGRYKIGKSGSEKLLSHTEVAINVIEQKNARDIQLASGKNVRDLIAVKRLWSFSYSKLPGEIKHTADQGLGFNDLVDLFNSTDQLSLVVPDPLSNSVEQVDVLISLALSGTITRRSPWVLWSGVTFTLLEI